MKEAKKRWLRTSLLMAKNGNNWLAPMLFGGTCNTNIFNAWLEKFLLKELRSNQTIVMDNAVIHKSQKTWQLIENAGHKLLFLPPYSPDLNPIEQSFGILKKRLRYAVDGVGLDELLCKPF